MLKQLTEKRIKFFWNYDYNFEEAGEIINDFIGCDKELDSIQLLNTKAGIITYHLRAGIWYFVKVDGGEVHALCRYSSTTDDSANRISGRYH